MRPKLSICIVVPRRGPHIEQKVESLIQLMHTLNTVQFSLSLIVYYKNIKRISEILGAVRLRYKISIIKGGSEPKYSVIKRIWKNDRSVFLGVFSLFYPSLHTTLPTMIEDLIANKCSIALGGIGPLAHQPRWRYGIQHIMIALLRIFVRVCVPYQLRNISNPVSHNFIINHKCLEGATYSTTDSSNLILNILFEHSNEPVIEYPLAMSLWNCTTTLLACLSRSTIQSLLRVKLTQIKRNTLIHGC